MRIDSLRLELGTKLSARVAMEAFEDCEVASYHLLIGPVGFASTKYRVAREKYPWSRHYKRLARQTISPGR